MPRTKRVSAADTREHKCSQTQEHHGEQTRFEIVEVGWRAQPEIVRPEYGVNRRAHAQDEKRVAHWEL